MQAKQTNRRAASAAERPAARRHRRGIATAAAVFLLLIGVVPFAADTIVFGPRTYQGTAKGVLTAANFRVSAGGDGYVLRVRDNSLTLAVVVLNNRVIIRPRDLGANIELPDSDANWLTFWNQLLKSLKTLVPGTPVPVVEKPVRLQSGRNDLVIAFVAPVGRSFTLEVVKRDAGDTIPPVITTTVTPTPNGGGWNNTVPVTVSFTCSDSGSGISTCSSPVTLSTEGVNQAVTGTAVDRAGNRASATATVNIDVTPPAITVASPANDATVSTNSVTVLGSIAPSTSPIAAVTCNGLSATLSALSFSCVVALPSVGPNPIAIRATDLAGNTGAADLTVVYRPPAPTITAVIAPDPNAAGWNHADVTVTFTCTNASSCPAPIIVSTEGANQVFERTVTGPGGSATASVTVNLDKSLPSIAVTSPAEDATVTTPQLPIVGTIAAGAAPTTSVTCGSAPAAVTTNVFSCSVLLTSGANTIEMTAIDAADNRDTRVLHVNYDPGTAVRITGVITPSPNLQGWNNTTAVVSFSCANATVCPSPITVATEGADQRFEGTATGPAGSASTTVVVNLDRTPPAVQIEPSAQANANGWYTSTVVNHFVCSDSLSGVSSCPADQVTATDGVDQRVSVTVTDRAGNSTSVSGNPINLDRAPPTIAASIQPPPDQDGVNHTDVTVTFTCTDATSGVAACPPRVVASSSGVINGTAADRAGNQSTAQAQVTIVRTTSAVTIATPSAGMLTRESTVAVTGSVDATSAVTVVVNDVPATVTGSGPFQFSATVPLMEGDNVLLASMQSTTAGGAQASVVVRRDTEAPVIISVDAPATVNRGQPAPIHVEADDPNGIAEVLLTVNGQQAGSLTAPPFDLQLSVPDGAHSGDTLDIGIEVRDRAGNRATTSRQARVGADAVITGRVLSDVTGLPLANASIRAGGTTVATTDEQGRYALSRAPADSLLSVEQAGMTSVQRPIQPGGTGATAPIDARLTPLATAVSVTTIDVQAAEPRPWSASISNASGAAGVRVTPLTPQGLPLLLPLGWSPVSALDIRLDAAGNGGFSAAFTGVSGATALVRHDAGTHTWRMVQPGLDGTSDAHTVVFPQPGTYALVTVDAWDPPIPLPAVGEVLSGASMATVTSNAATASGIPSFLPTTGGRVRGTVIVPSDTAIPSGTVIQAAVTETFTLPEGDTINSEPRYQDLILYRYPLPVEPPTGTWVSTLGAAFPLVPTRTFALTDRAQGNIHVELFSGREDVRAVVGGSQALEVESGSAHLSIAAGSLDHDTAVTFTAVPLSTFLPSVPAWQPLTEVVLDFAGAVLSRSATLSTAAPGVAGTDTLLIAKVEPVGGVPKLIAVALGRLQGGRVESVAYPGLTGVVAGGRYVFYRSASPIGFVGGQAIAQSAPVASAVIATESLPFVAISRADGEFLVPALVGSAMVAGQVPGSNLRGTATAVVTANTTVRVSLEMNRAVSTASVSPVSGSVGILTSTSIVLDASAAIDPASATASTVRLFRGPVAANQLVPVHFVLSAGGRSLSVIPDARLEPATPHTLIVSGLNDIFGLAFTVPTTTFTTLAVTPATFDATQLTFSFPDENGLIDVTAPAGTFPVGTTIQIINSSNGAVLTLTVNNDGSVSDALPGSIDDVMQVTITDPLGTVTTFSRSQYVAIDGTTAIGVTGGIVRGPGGVEVRVPEDAVDRGTRIRIEAFDANAYPERPVFPQATFGSGLRMVVSGAPVFRKPLDLAFPVPANLPTGARPEDAYYYIYRRLTGPNGQVAFETVDHAFLEGSGTSAKVVTASAPFAGALHNYNSFTFGGLTASDMAQFYLLWTLDQSMPGIPLKGVISGRIIRPTSTDTFEGIPSDTTQEPARVARVDAQGNCPIDPAVSYTGSPMGIAISQSPDGTYALWEDWPVAGPVTVCAVVNDGTQPRIERATGYQAVSLDSDSPTPALQHYRNRVTLNITFPARVVTPPTPAVEIVLLDPVTDTPPYASRRARAGGLVLAGTGLLVGFRTHCGALQCVVRNAQLDGQPFPAQPQPDGLSAIAPQHPLLMDFLLPPFSLSQVGTHRLTVTALNALNAVTTSSLTFSVVAAGGGPGDPLGTSAPSVLSSETSPYDGAIAVDTGAFLHVAFTEPVIHVPGNVVLEELTGQGTVNGAEVPLTLLGAGVNGAPVTLQGATAGVTAVTALTVQPQSQLKYGTRYRLTLRAGIIDLDPSPKNLTPAPYVIEFTTVRPLVGGSEEQFGSAGIAVLGTRAYLAENNFTFGYLRAFDLCRVDAEARCSEPMGPVVIPDMAHRVFGRPMGIAAQVNRATGVHEVAIVTGPARESIPSNLYLMESWRDDEANLASPAHTERVGAVSLSNTAQAGIVTRVALHRRLAYALTTLKGIQVVDLDFARHMFATQGGNSTDTRVRLATDGQGWGGEAVVVTIPVRISLPNGERPAFLSDLEVADLSIEGMRRPLVVAVGEAGLVIADPVGQSDTDRIRYKQPLQFQTSAGPVTLSWGYAVALGRLPVADALGRRVDHDVAVISGTGSAPDGSSSLLMVVDLENAAQPRVLSYLALPRATDIALHGTQAFVGDTDRIRMIDLVNVDQPRIIGEIPGTGGWIGLSDTPNGLMVFSTGRSIEPNQSAANGGIRTAALNPRGNLATLLTRTVTFETVFDASVPQQCSVRGERLAVQVFRRATVTVLNGGAPLLVVPDDSRCAATPVPLVDLDLEAGSHVWIVPRDVNFNGAHLLPQRLDMIARGYDDPSDVHRESGDFVERLVNPNFFPVGHVFVKGVDLKDAHMVAQAEDIAIPGRNLDLHVTRSYSSAGPSLGGAIGAGWTWNYAAGLWERRDCNCVTVQTADGTSQTFHTQDWVTFTPEKGYHGALVATRRDGTVQDLSHAFVYEYEFTDKSGTRHVFQSETGALPGTDPVLCPPRYRLAYIQEPHRDRIELEYESFLNRPVRISERHLNGNAYTTVRSLVLRYDVAGRIVAIEGEGPLGVSVVYEYSAAGDLIRVRRSGTVGGTAPPWVHQYEYGADHRMTASTDPNGSRVEYGYQLNAIAGTGMPGVVAVREFATSGQANTTQFSYDVSQLSSGVRRATVTDANGNPPTVYTMNSDGNPTRLDEPLGRTTRMTWAANDILKLSETDALGRVTNFTYDDKGNLTSQAIRTSDFGEVTSTFEYEHRYNKLVRKVDAEGRVTSYDIDPANGDVRRETDPVGNVTQHTYDDHGQLQQTTDARGFVTRHQDYDSFGNAGRTVPPNAVAVTRVYDVLGRLTSESDTQGHSTSRSYDQLGRVTRELKAAGGVAGNADSVTETSFYPGGQPQTQRNPNGALTTFDLDGLNRVVATSTSLGTGAPLTTATTYDRNGNVLTQRDRRGVVRQSSYDELNRLRSVAIVAGVTGENLIPQLSAYEYDLAGNKTSETDLAGLTTRFTYDGLYHLQDTIFPVGGAAGSYVQSEAHDRVGNRMVLTDRNGQRTRFEYDGLNRIVSEINPLGQAKTTAYADSPTAHVNKTEEHDETRGLRTSYAYDGMNREISRRVALEGAGGGGAVYTTATSYDDAANARLVVDPRGTVTRIALDGLNRTIEQVIDVGGLALRTVTTYDGLGNPASVTDPNGGTTQMLRDGLGRLTDTIDALGHPTRASFDGEGLKLSETDRRGVTRVFTYDNIGRPRRTQLTPSISNVPWSHEIVYEDTARRRTEIDARGFPTVETLDRLGRVVQLTDADNHSVVTTYDGVNKRSERDKRGNTTTFTYDALNRLRVVTDPAPFSGQTVETSYDDAGNRRIEKDRRGGLTVTQFDPLGRVVSVVRSGLVQERNAYDGNSNKVLATDGEGHQTRFEYDPANRLSARTDGYGSAAAATTTYAYDGNGNQTIERDARAAQLGLPHSKRSTYDALNRLTIVADGLNHVTGYQYDEEGNRSLERDPLGHETAFFSDELGKLTRVTQPGGIVTQHGYDPNRNRVTQADANSNTVTMRYDRLNRLEQYIQPGGLITAHAYDENGNERLLTDPKGQQTISQWDELNRLRATVYVALPEEIPNMWRHTTRVDYQRDANGNPTQIDESVASGTDPPIILRTTRAYDALDRLTGDTQPLPDGGYVTIGYVYYANGSRRSMTDPAGLVTTYAYDGQNRPATIATDAGSTQYSYYADGLVQQMVYPNGVFASYQYDQADRLTSLVNAHGEDIVASYAYTYDDGGNRLTQREVNGGPAEDTSYTYDELNRLRTVSYPIDTAFTYGRDVVYEYDAVGNRRRETERDSLGRVITEKLAVFNSLNQLVQVEDQVNPLSLTSFAYDRNGNQVSRTIAGITVNYLFDSRNDLIEARQGANVFTRSQYDFRQRRTKKIGQRNIRQYVYDDRRLESEYDAAAGTVATFVSGNERTIASFRRDESTKYHSVDSLGSTVALTSDDGAVSASYHFDAWGSHRFPEEVGASLNDFGFTGHLWDRETKTVYAESRFYDPSVARFSTQDADLGSPEHPSSLNRYSYAWSQPTRYVDPDGHSVQEYVERLANEAVSWWQGRGDSSESLKATVGYGVGLGFARVGQSVAGGITPWPRRMTALVQSAPTVVVEARSAAARATTAARRINDRPLAALYGLAEWDRTGAGETAEWAGLLAKGDRPTWLDATATAVEIGVTAVSAVAAEAQAASLRVGGLNRVKGVNDLGRFVKVRSMATDPLSVIDGLAAAGSSASAKEGYTQAGRAFVKHAAGQRSGSTLFPRLVGGRQTQNVMGQEILNDILTAPGAEFKTGFKVRPRAASDIGDTLEVIAPDGRGVVFDADRNMKMFVERKKE